MTEEQYRGLFRILGIQFWLVNHGRVLRYGGQSIRMYWNRNDRVGIYFAAYEADQVAFASRFWERIDSSLVKPRDRFNIVPRPVMEAAAFRDRLNHFERYGGGENDRIRPSDASCA